MLSVTYRHVCEWSVRPSVLCVHFLLSSVCFLADANLNQIVGGGGGGSLELSSRCAASKRTQKSTEMTFRNEPVQGKGCTNLFAVTHETEVLVARKGREEQVEGGLCRTGLFEHCPLVDVLLNHHVNIEQA